jgi:hypothetical protein
LPLHELSRQRRKPIDVILGPAVLDRHISMLEKALGRRWRVLMIDEF